MRKYLAAASIGALLLASQAAASDSDVYAGLGDRVGSQSGAAQSLNPEEGGLLIPLIVAVGLALIIWGATNQGQPSSP